MRWKNRVLTVALMSLFTGVPISAQQPVQINKIRFQKYDRFIRFDISVTQKPDFSMQDDLPNGILHLQINATLADELPLPQAEPGNVTVFRKGDDTVFEVRYPNKFRYNAFYYAPEKKIIIDIYPGNEPVVANSPVKNIPVTTGSPYASALTALQSGDTTKALALFTTAVKKDPGHARAHLQLGILQTLRKDTTAAITNLKKARENVELSFISNLYLQKLGQTQANQSLHRTDQKDVTGKPLKQENNAEKKEQIPTAANTEHLLQPKEKSDQNKLSLWLTYAGSAVALAVLIYLWRLMFRAKPAKKSDKDDQVQRILSLMEKNNLYRSTKANPATQKDDDLAPLQPMSNAQSGHVNLHDEPDPVEPVSPPLKEKIPLAEGYPPAEQRIESSRLRQIQRTMNENNVVPENRERLTATALNVKSQVLDYALDGYSVREIAEKLQVGVGEVELILGLKKSPGTKSNDDKSALRIDFSY